MRLNLAVNALVIEAFVRCEFPEAGGSAFGFVSQIGPRIHLQLGTSSSSSLPVYRVQDRIYEGDRFVA